MNTSACGYKMKKFKALYYIFKSDFIKEFADLKHYSFNYFIGIINQSIFCYLLIDAFSKKGETFVNLISKFFVWYIGRDLISEMSSSINEEKYYGTLEYIYLNTYKMEYYLLVKSLNTFLWSILFFIVISVILFVFTSYDSRIEIGSIDIKNIILIVFSLISFLGYGYFFAGLSLIFRKISAFVSIFGYLILFAQFISIDSKYSFLSFLVPGAWVKYNISFGLIGIISLFLLFTGWISFSLFLKLSTKGGYFWRV